jgi:hypothetical protein
MTWRAWAWERLLRDELTLGEVLERLRLERAYRLTGC